MAETEMGKKEAQAHAGQEPTEQNTSGADEASEESALQACQQQVQEWKDRYARVSADLENYRRRVAKDQSAWVYAAQARILRELLVVVDDFERAFAQMDKESMPEDARAWVDGFAMIQATLLKTLENCDVKPMEDTKVFNPEFHEAVMQVDSEEHTSGEIVTVLQKGYLFKDEVLRPARVSVAK